MPEATKQRGRWNPYLVGALIGVLSWAAFYAVDKPIGMSTSLAAISGAAMEPVIGREAVLQNPYWAKVTPKWDYGMIFLVGTFIGAFLSAIVSKTFHAEVVPSVWQERFGPSKPKRLFWAFVGGVLTLYGARMADGCTSGHGISGSLQLALSSWTFFITMFVAGLITAMIMFRQSATR